MTTLHVLNGDSARISLERSGIPGDFTIWADPLHDGPVPAGLDDDALARVRATHLFDGEGDVDDVLQTVRGWNAALERWAEYDEIVFWFEHDLFDQLILIRHLDWLAHAKPPSGRFSLICIGEYPGFERFDGLGQLSPEQLLPLFPLRVEISAAEIETGATAWRLFRAPDPTGLAGWFQSEEAARLRFLPGALRRHLEELPGIENGLSRSERQILAAIAGGHARFGRIFGATQTMEERVFMGDTSFRGILEALAAGRSPLLARNADHFTLTEAGREVLDGRADHVTLNGIDRWMGGVHLTSSSYWRWDGSRPTRAA
jgi:hypothetical protein